MSRPHQPLQVRAELKGFQSVTKPLIITGSRDVWDVAMTLGRLSDLPVRVISGAVLDERGRPVQSATVTLLTYDGQARGQTRTDPKGAFRMNTMDAGQYVAVVSALGFDLASRVVNLSGIRDTNARLDIRLRRNSLCLQK